MGKSFLNHDNPLLTVMLQCETPEVAIRRIRNANCLGAEAFCLQVECLNPEYHNPDTHNEYVGKETKTLPPKFILVHDYYLQ